MDIISDYLTTQNAVSVGVLGFLAVLARVLYLGVKGFNERELLKIQGKNTKQEVETVNEASIAKNVVGELIDRMSKLEASNASHEIMYRNDIHALRDENRVTEKDLKAQLAEALRRVDECDHDRRDIRLQLEKRYSQLERRQDANETAVAEVKRETGQLKLSGKQ